MAKQDLHDDNTRWLFNVDGETPQGPTPRWKATKNQWLMRGGESGIFFSQVSDPNTKGTAQNICTYEKHEMNLLGCVCVCANT